MKTITKKFIVKSWDELTDKEKEWEKKKNSDHIWEFWGECCFECYKEDIQEVKRQLKYISFDNVYINENSQGWWIEGFKNLTCNINNQTKNIYDIELDFGQLVDRISYVEIDDGQWVDFYILKELKGYKILYKKLLEDFEVFQNGINEAIKTYYNDIYEIPNEFVESFFEGVEFEFEYKGDEE